jgi:hypothetical protein
MNQVGHFYNTSGEMKVFLDHYPKRTNYGKMEGTNQVMIHVWDWANDWKIKVTENGKELDVVRKKAENPQYVLSYEVAKRLWTFDLGSASSKKKIRHPHMFHVTTSSPNSTLEVTVTDRFGNEYHQTMERPKPFHLHMK